MKRTLLLAALLAAAVPAAAADVGVSVSIGQPGFYGRVDIGSFPQPALIYPQPVVIAPPAIGVPVPRPIYLHVPPGHAKDWRKHCARYNACGQPVYFVQETWYQQVYVPRYQELQGHPGKGKSKGEHPGKGHGQGKGKGNH